MVLELINGAPLDMVMERHDTFLPVRQVVKWCITLCDVLSYLHTGESQPIVFRNVKPSNIMVDTFLRLRLIGFGFAKHYAPGEKGTLVVTDGYSSPESYRGLDTPLSDVFSVGALLHHMLTRRDPRLEPPFTYAERPIREINPKVPSELETIVMRALAFDGNERFESAENMKLNLQKLLSS